MSSDNFYLNTSHSSHSGRRDRSSETISGHSIQSSCKNSSSGRHQRKHPRHAIIVNFSDGESVTEDIVRSEFASFGAVRAVIMCTMDACQAFVTFYDEPGRPARHSVSQLLRITNGIMFVHGKVWTICRPKTWKKLTDDATSTSVSDLGSGKTVSELTDIFQNFVRQNSSISQVSVHSPTMFSPSMQSFSSVSVNRGPASSTSSSAAGSCDSSTTITPFSFYPVQQSSGVTVITAHNHPISPGFIQLPPPYHLLPDTAFFRRTKIVPPPSRRGNSSSLMQKITDQYIASARKSDSASVRSVPTISSSKLELNCSWWNPM